jgi:hypothetical protein
MPTSRVTALRLRAEQCQRAVETFVRIHEELLEMKRQAAVGVAKERIEAMIRLNKETTEAIKENLSIAEAELSRLN